MYTLSKSQSHLIPSSAVVVAFSLGATVSTLLISLRTKWEGVTTSLQAVFDSFASFTVTWIGTPAEYSGCLQSILDDIWTDPDQQLDAWQQLYALACVKSFFRRMWKIGDEAKVARWIDSEDSAFDSTSASENDSDSDGEQSFSDNGASAMV